MGGHGGLNILPQKRWNVYNFDNREKVRLDEEAAAKEEQLKREQSRKRDAEFRLERLRQSRGLSTKPAEPASSTDDLKHINLFEGLSTFPSLDARKPDNEIPEEGSKKKQRKGDRKEGEVPRVILPEDEKYRLGYGLAGKGVKAPWYLVRPSSKVDEKDCSGAPSKEGSKKRGKKTLEELREERIQREKREKGRERELMLANRNGDRAANAKVKGFSRYRDVGEVESKHLFQQKKGNNRSLCWINSIM